MHIARVSVLTGHVLGSVIQAMISLAIVIGVALLVGFRPSRRAGRVAGHCRVPDGGDRSRSVWLCVALGQVSKSVETGEQPADAARCCCPFLSSGFVPTDSMPAGPALVRRAPAVHSPSSKPCAAC
jgi:ABC-2 type transport system permease protein